MSKVNLVAYHGTATKFSAFRFAKSDWHPSKIGVWFSSTEEAAVVIANRAKRMVDDVPRVISARVQLDNPARFDTYSDYLAAFRDSGGSAFKLRSKLRRAGFDGVEIVRSDTDDAGDRTDYAVFDAHQMVILESTECQPEEMQREDADESMSPSLDRPRC